MQMTRKEFLALSAGAAWSLSRAAFPAHASSSLVQDVVQSTAVQKIHELIEAQKDQHISRVQADLRQPSVSSWNMGIQEMADRMVESFRELGCKEATRVETKGFPGVFAHYDAGAPKTVVVYMMYDTQPFEKERWTRDPLAAERGPMGEFADVIIARGAINSKGPNRFFLNACQAIVEVEGKLPVNVLFTCDSPNFHQVLDPYRDRLKRASCLLDASPSQQRDGLVTMALGTKGILEFEIEASGASWGRGPQKMPIHSSRKAVLDSPVWRLLDALRSMYDPEENRILVEGFYDDIRPPNEEESMLMETLVTRFRDRLFTSEKENIQAFMKDWTPEEAARRLTFDTTMNIDGIWAGYTGPGSATILPEKATAKIDCRLVPNQEIARQKERVLAHLERKGFSDLKLTLIGGGMEWSQTSVAEPVVQSILAMYREAKIEPMIWPRSAGSSPQYEYTRKLGLPAGGGGLGHGGRAHADDEYIVIEGNDRVAGIVKAEQSMVDILFTYAAHPEASGNPAG
jgi:acetylornithine deacetylase/succinyl-diaminopimelate desuccinylase-like protein